MNSKRNLNKDIILDAAADLAEEVGLYNITLNKLAEKLGVKSPSLYTYFNGFDDLYAALMVMSMNRLENTIRNAAVGKSKGEALMSIALAHRQFAKENPEIYKIDLIVPSTSRKDVKESASSVVGIILQVMEAYSLGREKTTHFIRGLRSAIHGFVSLEQAGYFTSPVDVDESFITLVKSLIFLMESETYKK
jgi:AcrR family transcriptional regulator